MLLDVFQIWKIMIDLDLRFLGSKLQPGDGGSCVVIDVKSLKLIQKSLPAGLLRETHLDSSNYLYCGDFCCVPRVPKIGDKQTWMV